MKICSKCKIEKELSEFYKRKNTKDELQYQCKECVNDYSKKQYENNPEYFKKHNKKWYEKYHNFKVNFDTYAKQISWANDPVRDINGFLQTKCTYCGKWYFPTNQSIKNRIKALNGRIGNGATENRLYCSDECKEVCPIYRKQLYQVGHPKLNENNQTREVQPELRQMVFERDNYTCLKCKRQNVPLHCHHIEGILWNPLESADIDQCMTVCKDCHEEIHKQNDCGYHDLQCKKAA